MPKLNMDNCFKQPAPIELATPDKFSDEWLNELIKLCAILLELSANQSDELKMDMDRHIGPKSVYAQKENLTEFIQTIYFHLRDPNKLSPSNRKAIVQKFHEGAAACTPGFYNRNSELLRGLSIPGSMDDYFLELREWIVGLVALQMKGLNEDVHVRTAVFNRGVRPYKVRAVNENDPYLANNPDNAIPTKQIDTMLKAAFEEHYQIPEIINRLFENIKGTLHSSYDYFGKKVEGYKNGPYEKWGVYLGKIFDLSLELPQYLLMTEDSIVYDLNWPFIKKALFETLIKSRYFLFSEKEIQMMTLLFRKMEQEDYLEKRITLVEPTPKEREKDEKAYKEYLEKRKMRDEMDKELGITLEKGIATSIDIKTAIPFVNAITINSSTQFYQLLSFFSELSLNARSQLLIGYLESVSKWLPVWGRQKRIAALAKHVEAFQHDKHFFPLTLATIKNYGVTSRDLIQFIGKGANERNFLLIALKQKKPLHLILVYLDSIDVYDLYSILTSDEKEPINPLFYALKNAPETLPYLLTLLNKLPLFHHEKLLMPPSKGAPTLLEEVIRFHPKLIRPLLKHIEPLEPRLKANILLTSNAYLIMLQESENHLEIKKLFLKYIVEFEYTKQIGILDRNTALTQAFQDCPQAVEPLLDRIKQLSSTRQKEELKQLLGDKNILMLAATYSNDNKVTQKITEKVLELMSTWPVEEQIEAFCFEDNNNNTVLSGMAEPAIKMLFFNHIMDFPHAQQTKIFGIIQDNALMSATRTQPEAIEPLVDKLYQQSFNKQVLTLIQKNAYNFSLLMEVVKNHCSVTVVKKVLQLMDKTLSKATQINLFQPAEDIIASASAETLIILLSHIKTFTFEQQEALLNSSRNMLAGKTLHISDDLKNLFEEQIAYLSPKLQESVYSTTPLDRRASLIININKSQAPLQIELYQPKEVIQLLHTLQKTNPKNSADNKKQAFELEMTLQLAQFTQKATELSDPTASKVAKKLAVDLLQALNEYRATTRDKMATRLLKNQWKMALNDPDTRSTLAKHRGIQDILAGLLLCFTGIGLIYLAYRFFTVEPGKSLILTRTKSIQKMDALNETVAPQLTHK